MSYIYAIDSYNENNIVTDPSIPYILYSDLSISGSIDAAYYDYDLDSYEHDVGDERTDVYVVYPANPINTSMTTDLAVLSSVDSAVASLQIGMDSNETQVIEMGSAEIMTTIYGFVTVLQAANASSLKLANNLDVEGRSNLTNVSATGLTVAGPLWAGDSRLANTTVTGNLVAGNCSLNNVSCTSLQLNQTSFTSTNGSYTLRPQVGSNQGVLELGSTYGRYNVPYSDTETEGGLVFRSTKSDGTPGTSLMTLRSMPNNTTTTSTTGTNIALIRGGYGYVDTLFYLSPNEDGTVPWQYESTSVEQGTAVGRLTIRDVVEGNVYKICARMNAKNANTTARFDILNGAYHPQTSRILEVNDVSATTIHLFYFKATHTGKLSMFLSRPSSTVVSILYDFFSIEPWYETTLSSLAVTGSTTITGNVTINNPLNINYATTTTVQPIRANTFAQVFSANTIYSATFDSNTAGQVQAVANGLPYGRYLAFTYLYIRVGIAAQTIELRCAYYTSTLTNGQLTAFNLFGDGIGEAFGYKSDATSHFSLNATFLLDLNTTTGNNIGVWSKTGSINTNTFCTLQLVRLS